METQRGPGRPQRTPGHWGSAILRRLPSGRWRAHVAGISRDGSPCEKLHAAMLLDAVRILTKPTERDNRREVLAWLQRRTADAALPFTQVCEVLDVDADTVRQDIIEGLTCKADPRIP
jgi:hypothetical protein